MKTVIKVLLVLAVVLMGYVFVRSITTPVKFKRERERIEHNIATRLKDIATYENAFRNVHGRFATAEELVTFLESGEILYIRAEGDYTDEMREKGLSESQAAHQGLIRRDTLHMAAKDSLLKGSIEPRDVVRVPGFPEEMIEIHTAHIDQVVGSDTVKVPVFAAQVPMDVYLKNLDAVQRAVAIHDAKERNNGKGYPGLKLGSLDEVKTTGNWE